MNTEIRNKLIALKKPTIRLQLHGDKSNSKFGGLPSVETASFQWPTYNNAPLAFLGQIDLAEMTQVLNYEWLPKTGHLLFFYDLVERCSGSDPTERSSWRVVYQENPDSIAPYPEELGVESKLQEQFILGSIDSRLPPSADHIHIPTSQYTLTFDEFQQLTYMKIDEYEALRPYHQLGGYPTDGNFNSLRMDAQLALNGLEVYYSVSLPESLQEISQQASVPNSYTKLYDTDAANKVKSGADDWELLLQIDTDENVGESFSFGEGDKLFFYVQKQKAISGNFEDSWMFAERLY